MSDRDDFVRSFGMSGFLITDDIRQIEQRFDIELGHVEQSVGPRATEYYPQFEQSVRAEAAEMSQHYELFYCLERSIRSLVTDAMTDAAGPMWWDTKVPQQIRQEVAQRKTRDTESGTSVRSDRHIDFTDFGELSVIISANWAIFSTVLSNERAMQRVMANLNLLRGPIAHCCPILPDEVDRLRLSVKDWFRLFG